MKTRKKKKLKTGIIAKLILVICIMGIIYSGYHIIKWKLNVSKNANIKDDINKLVKVKKGKYKIDFNKLIKMNDETVAYLKVKGTDIKYAVVKTDNNKYYLNHNFKKKYNVAGWIFADYRNKFDGSDYNIIIYGHNMKDTSMFGTLANVLKKDWYKKKKNHLVTLVTKEKTYKYKVFSTYTIKPEDYYITTDFNSQKAFGKFVDKLKKRSIYDYKTDTTLDDKILTLSTCNDDGSKRIVLHAKLVKESKNS